MTYDLEIISINSQSIFFTNHTIQLLNFTINSIELVVFLFLACAFIKSAQFGPHI
jgi:hypothetical protein